MTRGPKAPTDWRCWLVVICVMSFALSACTDPTTPKEVASKPTHAVTARVEAEPEPSATTAEPPTVVLLYVTDQKDGDSWIASDGNEYRLGLVNTPETNEPCGAEAAAFTRQFLATGFTADAYATDTYGRHVAEVFNEAGASLNVALARSGLGDGRYLEEFRHENPALAKRLERALATAPRPDCKKSGEPAALVKKPTTTRAPKSDCMVGYSPCLPVVADLDCGEIGHPVTVTGSDPYRLDRDHDGTGCD